MASRLTTLIARRDKLEAAIGQGALTITTDGQTVTWRSIDEIEKALKFTEAKIAEINGEAKSSAISSFDLRDV